MSGHSKWNTIKRKKGKEDTKRGKAFTKFIKEITVAARLGGGDPEGNPHLRAAIAAAKAENMPKENIERAIKKGTGELPGVTYEESIFEGYGPGGVAVLVEAMTDNKKRAAAEIRHIFSKNGGSLGESGCVSWMFSKKGLIVVERGAIEEEKLLEIALEAGAEDVAEIKEDKTFEIYVDPVKFNEVKEAFEKNKYPYILAQISMIPQSYIKLEEKEAEQMLHLMNVLEECEDVQNVYANFDIPEKIMEGMGR